MSKQFHNNLDESYDWEEPEDDLPESQTVPVKVAWWKLLLSYLLAGIVLLVIAALIIGAVVLFAIGYINIDPTGIYD